MLIIILRHLLRFLFMKTLLLTVPVVARLLLLLLSLRGQSIPLVLRRRLLDLDGIAREQRSQPYCSDFQSKMSFFACSSDKGPRSIRVSSRRCSMLPTKGPSSPINCVT